jgi:hypothetical protein
MARCPSITKSFKTMEAAHAWVVKTHCGGSCPGGKCVDNGWILIGVEDEQIDAIRLCRCDPWGDAIDGIMKGFEGMSKKKGKKK